MGYWGGVYRRAWREALDQLKWTSPLRVAQSIAPTTASGAVTWAATGVPAYAAGAAVGALCLICIAWFIERAAKIPAEMDAELRSKLKRQVSASERAEKSRRGSIIDRLAIHYVLGPEPPGEPLRSQISAGLKLPPADWLNEQLAGLGEEWSVFDVNGTSYSTMEVRPLSVEEKATRPF